MLAALVVSAPSVWRQVESFEPGKDYRIPYALSSDYWLYQRYCNWAADNDKIAVVGDSVIWGHYVAPDETLSHYLNVETDSERFANLGLDGTHPAALAGLIAHYGGALAGRPVLIQFNPLWLTSEKHDLQTDKEFHFNHPDLVPQFTPKIPCYRASLSKRLWTVAERSVPFVSWTSHLQTAYFGGTDLPHWTLAHPYANPLGELERGLPSPALAPPEQANPADNSDQKRAVAWVPLESSLQWRFFREAVERLRREGSTVFVLVGPINEETLTEADAAVYAQMKRDIVAWLQSNGVPHLAPEPLPPSLYADFCHPIAGGYAQLAAELGRTPAFQAAFPTVR